MDLLGWLIVCISSGLAVLALWTTSSLRRTVKHLTRNEYYRDGRMREMSDKIQRDLDIMRIQLAHLASGQSVEADLIRSGRLYTDITPGSVAQLLAGAHARGFSIIDVRPTKEYAGKHLPSAKSIPLEELESRCQGEIPKTLPGLIVYCDSGERSQLACDYLSRHGWTAVHHLTGGLQQWTGPTEGMGNVQLVQIQSRSKVSRS